MEESATRQVKTYSGGMRRRLDLAASLVVRAEVYFLDEPTTGLDPASRAQVHQLIRAIVAGGATVLLTTQYLEEADQLAARLAVINHGRVIAEGTPDELKASPRSRPGSTAGSGERGQRQRKQRRHGCRGHPGWPGQGAASRPPPGHGPHRPVSARHGRQSPRPAIQATGGARIASTVFLAAHALIALGMVIGAVLAVQAAARIGGPWHRQAIRGAAAIAATVTAGILCRLQPGVGSVWQDSTLRLWLWNMQGRYGQGRL